MRDSGAGGEEHESGGDSAGESLREKDLPVGGRVGEAEESASGLKG
jgi:hypothetical protein